jgi:3-oxoacyl-[acyl-carrier protein] reductase
MRLDGKRAIVTGGASGIGEAICRRFTREGATVAILDIDEARARKVAAELKGAIVVVADVCDSSAVDAAFADVARRLGSIEILVNNAGAPTEETADALKAREKQVVENAAGEIESTLDVTSNLTNDQWKREISLYLDGTFYCTRAALRIMRPKMTGAIVNISSIHGIAGGTGLPHYSAAKAGVLGFTRSVAKEVAPLGIRVNAVTPGYTVTPVLERFMPAALRKATAQMTPMKRLGASHEIAALVAFLCSEDASFITGETVSADGGWLTV